MLKCAYTVYGEFKNYSNCLCKNILSFIKLSNNAENANAVNRVFRLKKKPLRYIEKQLTV